MEVNRGLLILVSYLFDMCLSVDRWEPNLRQHASRSRASGRCKRRRSRGDERPVHDEAGVTLDLGRVAAVVMDAVAVEGERARSSKRAARRRAPISSATAPPPGMACSGGATPLLFGASRYTIILAGDGCDRPRQSTKSVRPLSDRTDTAPELNSAAVAACRPAAEYRHSSQRWQDPPDWSPPARRS
jgi:hypothetical protein